MDPSMDSQIESWLEEKIGTSRSLLSKLKEEGRIGRDFYLEASSWVSDLASQVRTSIASSDPLIQSNDLRSAFDLFSLYPKESGNTDTLQQMRSIVKEYSKKTRIQSLAIREILEGRKKSDMPEVGENWFPPVNLLYDSDEFIETFRPIVCSSDTGHASRIFLTDLNDAAVTFIDDCIIACGSLFDYVLSKRQVPDPPDEWLKEPHQTILNGGDCDDLAILYCSLARSVGFQTYLGFQPGHVFPGVILRTLNEIDIAELPPNAESQVGELVEMGASEVYELVDARVSADPTLPIPSITLKSNGGFHTFSYFGIYTQLFSRLYSSLEEKERENLEPLFRKINDGLDRMSNPRPEIQLVDN